MIVKVRNPYSLCEIRRFNSRSPGLLTGLSLDIKERVCCMGEDCADDASAESEIEYPLTPPLTDESRSISPDFDILPELNTSTIDLFVKRVHERRTIRNVVKRRNTRGEHPAVVILVVSWIAD